MSTITFWVKSLFSLSIGLGLSACTTLVAIHRADNITWSTPYLNQVECANLNGTFEDKGKLNIYLYRLVANPSRSNEERTLEFTEYRRTSHAEKYESIPYKIVYGNVMKFSSAENQQAYERENLIFLRDKAVVDIRLTSPHHAEATSLDKTGIRYNKSVYRFEKMSPRFTVGCYQGAFIIRKVSIVSGEHTPAARTQANETHFTRLPNGDLQITDTERAWSPNSETPRTKTTSEVFKLYRFNN